MHKLTVGRLWRFERPLLITTVVLIIFVSLYSLLFPFIIKASLDGILPKGIQSQFNLFCLGMVGLIVSRFFLSMLQDYVLHLTRQKMEKRLSMEYIASLMDLRLGVIKDMETGDLKARLSNNLNAFQYFAVEFIFFCAYAGIISLIVLLIILYISPLVFGVLAAFMLVHVGNFLVHRQPLGASIERLYPLKGRMTDYIGTCIKGMMTTQSLWLQRVVLADFRGLAERHARLAFAKDAVAVSQDMVQNFLLVGSFIMIIMVCAYQIMLDQMTLGSTIFMIMLLGFAYEPIYRLSQMYKASQEAWVRIKRLYELVDSPDRVVVSGSAARESDVTSLELDDVSFSHVPGQPLLSSASVSFTPGSLYVLIGPSGTGKSTVLKLLMGQLQPDEGSIRLNGVDINSLPQQSIRTLTTFNAQEGFIFGASVTDNISSFHQEASPDRVRHTARLAVADTFIEDLPQQWETALGNDGVALSGGQRQRLNIARALYLDRPIILLDEPTASLDEATEAAFISQLHTIKHDRIVIVVTHRKQLIDQADVVVTLDGLNTHKKPRKVNADEFPV